MIPLDTTAALAMAAVALAGFVRGFSGFGAAMIIVPSLSILYSPIVAVPVMVLTDSLCTAPMVWRAARVAVWREVLPLVLSAAVMLPVGVQLLVVLDPELLRSAMGGFVLVVVAAMATGWRYSGTVGRPATLATGATAGFLGGSIGIAGPPVILFWLAGQGDAAAVRSNLITFFGCTSVISLLSLGVAGLFTAEVVSVAAMMVPAYAVALFLGARAFGQAGEGLFRRVALGIVAAIGVSALAAGLT